MSQKRLPKAQTGRADELEAVKFLSTKWYHVKANHTLPHPSGIPFGVQGQPIPDPYNRHTSYREVIQLEDPNHDDNPLPFMYWTGKRPIQINKGGPTFKLGVNEDRK